MRATLRPFLLCSLMFTGATLAEVLKPRAMLAEQSKPINLERMVPASFGDWREVPVSNAAIIDPGQQELINTIYTETLTRTYSNSAGYLMMLSIAYGKDQRDALQVHRPDICYPAQGFTLLSKQSAHLGGSNGLPLTRMQTRQGSRFEPVSYWTMIGDHPYAGSLSKKINEIRYGLTGIVPDGMLVRVSSIDRDEKTAYGLQESFSLAMIAAIPADIRPRFAGY